MPKKEPSDTVAKRLGQFLADTAILYVKTLNFHWNMVGPEFFMYHKLLEEQYNQLADALDEIAERIRMIGPKAPGSMEEFLSLGQLKEGKGGLSQEKMVFELVKDHLTMVGRAKELIKFSEAQNDPGTADLLIQRLRSHDKNAWLLRSHSKR